MKVKPITVREVKRRRKEKKERGEERGKIVEFLVDNNIHWAIKYAHTNGCLDMIPKKYLEQYLKELVGNTYTSLIFCEDRERVNRLFDVYKRIAGIEKDKMNEMRSKLERAVKIADVKVAEEVIRAMTNGIC